jgi:hypothetical protein
MPNINRDHVIAVLSLLLVILHTLIELLGGVPPGCPS